MLTAAVAMGIAQLVAGLTVAQSSPVLAVGQAAIDLTPLPVKDFAISTFGADDKNALLVGILIILAAFAAVIGILAVRRLALGLLGLAVFACIGLAAALTRPTATAGIRDPHPGRRRGRRLRADPPGPRGERDRLPGGRPGPRAVPRAKLEPPDLPGRRRMKVTDARVLLHLPAQPGRCRAATGGPRGGGSSPPAGSPWPPRRRERWSGAS